MDIKLEEEIPYSIAKYHT